MRRTKFALAAVAALALALAPGWAEARAGGGRSMGSRGSMTYSAPPATRTAPNSTQPMQQTLTPRQSSTSPGFGTQGYQPRSSFTSGLMGGLIGAGIGGLLFGHGFWGGGLGFGGFLGFLLQIFLLVMLGRFLFRRFLGSRQAAMAGGPGIFTRGAMSGPGAAPGGGMFGGGSANPPQVQIGPSDYQQFEQLLQGVQAAWSQQDLNGLRAMATPEMVSYFSEQLSDQASRGVRNTVTDVQLVSGDLSQAWAEQGREYATVAMRFSMIDVTRDGAGHIVDGSPTEHLTATEIWTFVRANGGHWVLSAIQQTG